MEVQEVFTAVEPESDQANTMVEQLFSREHRLVAARTRVDSPRARFLLASARPGANYRTEELYPLAVGVELLAEAIRQHYETIPDPGDGDPSTSVLGGDRIYALAMKSICSVGRSDLIGIAAKTVQRISEAEAAIDPIESRARQRRMQRESDILEGALQMAEAAAEVPRLGVEKMRMQIPIVAAENIASI